MARVSVILSSMWSIDCDRQNSGLPGTGYAITCSLIMPAEHDTHIRRATACGAAVLALRTLRRCDVTPCWCCAELALCFSEFQGVALPVAE